MWKEDVLVCYELLNKHLRRSNRIVVWVSENTTQSGTEVNEGRRNFVNPLTPNDHYRGRTASLTSKRFILYIYSTNIGTEYFKRGIYSPCFSLQIAVFSIIITYLVHVLFMFYLQGVLKLKKNEKRKTDKMQQLDVYY